MSKKPRPIGRAPVSSVSQIENSRFSNETITTSNANKMSNAQNLILNPPVKLAQALKTCIPLKNNVILSRQIENCQHTIAHMQRAFVIGVLSA